MCGIFAYLAKQKINPELRAQITKNFEKIKHRGPDNSQVIVMDESLFFGFHRLAINGLDHDSDEPIRDGDVVLMCNGEIYNHRELIERFKLTDSIKTHNDCEVILHLYKKVGFGATVSLLDGVFSIILYDGREGHDQLWIANDPIGIRPLYTGITDDASLVWASEPIALADLCTKVKMFSPGCYQEIKFYNRGSKLKLGPVERYFHYSWEFNDLTPSQIYPRYRELMTAAVRKRLMGEREIACLLSGGLDSSLVSALTAQELKKIDGRKLHTFSIGLADSPDLVAARSVASWIGSEHHEVVVTEEEFLACIPDVVRAIQSYDVTTVRASCGNYLIAKYIAENTDFKIILNGDVSEEIHASYAYSRFAPSEYEFHQDNIKLLTEVHKYDVLRSARCIEHFGLECRTPFADKELVNFVMSIHPRYKMFGGKKYFPMEKMILRNAFVGTKLLPAPVLWRPKTAFSDGVSKKTRSWHEIIQEHVEKLVSFEEYRAGHRVMWMPQVFSKEAYYYRKLYHLLLGDRPDMDALIGEYWMPRFVKASDPSARELQKD